MELETTGKELVERFSSVAERLDDESFDHGPETSSIEELMSQLDLSSPTGQALVDVVAMDMPRILAKFAASSYPRYREMALSTLEKLLEFCDPRDMFAAYMEALHLYSEQESLSPCLVLLDGVPKIFKQLKRRKTEFFKECIPGLLDVARISIRTGLYVPDVLDKLVHLVASLHDISAKIEVEEQRWKFQQALGVFSILILAKFIKVNELDALNDIEALFIQLAKMIHKCGFSYVDMVSGNILEGIMDSFGEESEIGDLGIHNLRLGAVIAVLWCAKLHKEDQEVPELVCDVVRNSRVMFLATLSNVSVLLIPQAESWKTVEMCIDFLVSILELPEGKVSQVELEYLQDFELLKLKAFLQAIQNVVIFCPNSTTRQSAYKVFVKVIRQVIPHVERFEILKSMIMDCKHSSMVSLLVYIVKEEVNNAISSTVDGRSEAFASSKLLELIDFILRPPVGGPPEMPEQIDAVMSALNLYRFILIKENSGKTNYTGVLHREKLQYACTMWFKPLRTFLEGFRKNLDDDNSEEKACLELSLSNLEAVLCRCLELAEEALKHSPC